MLTSNPFAELSAYISPGIMQAYVIVMAILVAGGTIFDVLHKKSAAYFFANMEKSKTRAKREVGGGEKAALAVKTLLSEVATSAEFANPKRRASHLMTMWGTIIYLVATVALVFAYPTMKDAGLWPLLWFLGAVMAAIGGYWFWFFIRVDVSAEGNPPFRFTRADIFIVSLLLGMTFGIVWALLQNGGGGMLATLFLALYLLATTVLFGSIPWSKFSHMFFKPAAAFEKRVSKANGFAQNLPTLSRDEPEQRKRHSMELLVDAPMSMGLGIKREPPHHY